jgi:hypothetical protein
MNYEKSKNHLYAEKWFKDNGFEIVASKQYIHKTIFTVRKNEFEANLDIQNEVINIESYMKCVEKLFNLKMLASK